MEEGEELKPGEREKPTDCFCYIPIPAECRQKCFPCGYQLFGKQRGKERKTPETETRRMVMLMKIRAVGSGLCELCMSLLE